MKKLKKKEILKKKIFEFFQKIFLTRIDLRLPPPNRRYEGELTVFVLPRITTSVTVNSPEKVNRPGTRRKNN